MSNGSVFNPDCITYSQMNLIFNTRIYYRRLITWIRAYILSRYAGIGTVEELFGRMYLEALNIGNMLEIIFGRAYAEQYGQLVSQFVIIFRNLIDARIAGDEEAIRNNTELLYQNVADRSDFLASLNPYWNEEEYIRIFGDFIQFIIDIADTVSTAMETGDYSSDIPTYDRLAGVIRQLGDIFAQGLYDYLTSGASYPEGPSQTGGQCITYDEMDAIFGIRMFWFELATWTRNYMLSRYVGLGNADQIFTRLRQVADDYVTVLKQIFGDAVPEDYVQLFYTYFDLLNAFITAQLEGNIDEVGRITQLLYRNADERAAAIASVNPFWDVNEWRARLYNNLRATIDQSTTFLNGDYARNIDIFSRILDAAEGTSNYFVEGIFQYLNLYQHGQEAALIR